MLSVGSGLARAARARGYGAGRSRALGAGARRALGLPRSAWGTALAHAGVGVVVIGIVLATNRISRALSGDNL